MDNIPDTQINYSDDTRLCPVVCFESVSKVYAISWGVGTRLILMLWTVSFLFLLGFLAWMGSHKLPISFMVLTIVLCVCQSVLIMLFVVFIPWVVVFDCGQITISSAVCRLSVINISEILEVRCFDQFTCVATDCSNTLIIRFIDERPPRVLSLISPNEFVNDIRQCL